MITDTMMQRRVYWLIMYDKLTMEQVLNKNQGLKCT